MTDKMEFTNDWTYPQGPTGNLKRAPWGVDFLLRRRVRKAMTNGQFVTYCRSAELIR